VLDAHAAPEATAATRWSRVAAIGVAALAAAVFLVRLPSVISDFDHRASVNAKQSALGREIQGSDALDISNEFLKQALGLIPRGATYVLERPPSVQAAQSYHISPTTFNAVPDYTRFVMLPRRETSPDQAEYLLCYACDTAPFDKRMTRLWTDPQGFVIGKLRR
jgi:hypothetical protein